MSQVIHDLSGPLLVWLNTRTALVNEVGGSGDARIFQPYTPGVSGDGSGWDEETNPKIMFKQVGGYPDYRYLFVVEANEKADARRIAHLLHNELVNGPLELRPDGDSHIVITSAEPEGGISDSANEVTKAPQAFFYARLTSI